MDGIADLINFLLRDCCGGDEEQCAPILQATLCSNECIPKS
jgi:hypothetical protein